ncbi:hypothetical protein [Pseudobacteriovorax antillogorgiicola]|uniref:Uncharacterized protein n=1 Tax=Pseudobacteriovorax antillogorgiicola TaxID=1513793 RepID=A0A1Y6CMN1_9BACT|nr:hypothetical protein [Pseudobacteriovorax antillogorgiicola]TCS45001.1 hypothetical protein EDD56_13038 [Pseudobacteriovorax antillogorgiicola]SMF76490.1 hypothetical protein SAMN06296036_13036 [Pseudobacteriovorax antillogorgiicola]
MWSWLRKVINYTKSNESVSLVYFVGRGRTHRHRLSSRFIVIGSLTAVFLSLFGIAAVIASGMFIESRNYLVNSLRERTEQVLNYQSQYENIFEQAYDDTPQLENQMQTEPAAPVINLKDWQEAKASPLFFISRLTMTTLARGGTSIEFSLSNTSESLLKGYSWGVAKLQLADGNIKLIGIPNDQVILTESGSIMDLSLANSFSFRKRWNSQLNFSLPSGVEGAELVGMMLYFADQNGELLARYPFKPLGPTAIELSSH